MCQSCPDQTGYRSQAVPRTGVDGLFQHLEFQHRNLVRKEHKSLLTSGIENTIEEVAQGVFNVSTNMTKGITDSCQ
jgi:hypothetical protein